MHTRIKSRNLKDVGSRQVVSPYGAQRAKTVDAEIPIQDWKTMLKI